MSLPADSILNFKSLSLLSLILSLSLSLSCLCLSLPRAFSYCFLSCNLLLPRLLLTHRMLSVSSDAFAIMLLLKDPWVDRVVYLGLAQYVHDHFTDVAGVSFASCRCECSCIHVHVLTLFLTSLPRFSVHGMSSCRHEPLLLPFSMPAFKSATLALLFVWFSLLLPHGQMQFLKCSPSFGPPTWRTRGS